MPHRAVTTSAHAETPEDLQRLLAVSFHPRALARQVLAHLRFVLHSHYPLLAFAAFTGRSLKFVGTLVGWAATPLYKKFVNPDSHSTNILYDALAPLLRAWFVQLSRQSYELNTVLDMIAMERRGAVICEACFTVLQIALYSVPEVLLPLTVLGVLLNAIPRQFYAQLKILMRSLHLSFLAPFSEQLLANLNQGDKQGVTYGGRPVFNAEGREAPAQYLAMQGSHHGGCWQVVVREGVDFGFSLLGGLLMVYLLLLAILEGLHLIGNDVSEAAFQYFPFWAVTLARVLKTVCNYVTTENLLRVVLARQTQNELYFFQRIHIVKRRRCPRAGFLFIGKPCLEHQPQMDFTGPLSMFTFLKDPTLKVDKYQGMLDDVMVLPWKKVEMHTRTTDGELPPSFASQAVLDELKEYAARVLWMLFAVKEPQHTECPSADHEVECAHKAQTHAHSHSHGEHGEHAAAAGNGHAHSNMV